VAPAARAKPRKVQFCGDFDDINYDRHERSIITLQRFFRVRSRTLYRISAWNESSYEEPSTFKIPKPFSRTLYCGFSVRLTNFLRQALDS
jgi:hypothetical protein